MTLSSPQVDEQFRRLSVITRECLAQAREMLDGADNRETLEALLHREGRERQILQALLIGTQEEEAA